MTDYIIKELINQLPAILVALVTIIANSKLISYKIEQLELKVEKHNNLVEDVAVLKRDLKTAFSYIDDTRNDIEKIENRLNK